MSDNLQIFWTSLSGCAVGTAAVGVLFTFLFNRSLEHLKNQLRKYEIEFSWLHQARAKAIVKAYAKVIDLHQSITDIGKLIIRCKHDVTAMRPQLIDLQHKSINEFDLSLKSTWIYLSKIQIYFPSTDYEAIKETKEALLAAGRSFIELSRINFTADETKKELDVNEKRVISVIEMLQTKFQAILKVHEQK